MKNKNLLITGAATRVGRAIALHFAEKGWNIALHYFRSSSKAKKLKKIIEQNWVKVALIKADLKNPKQTEKIMSLARKKLGTIDCLINNAALFEKDDIANFTTKSWNDHLNINLLAPTILTKEFAKQASKKTVSNIINIIDQRIFNLTPFFMSYTISKSGLQTLTKTMAMRLGPNIKVNAIAPGPIPTENFKDSMNMHTEEREKELKKYIPIPLNRWGSPEDIGAAVVFMASNASSWVTGQCLFVDGGT